MDATALASSSRKLKFGSNGSTATPVSSGMAFPVADLIQTFKPEVWEDFTEEWAHSQEKKYKQIVRYTGAVRRGTKHSTLLKNDLTNYRPDDSEMRPLLRLGFRDRG